MSNPDQTSPTHDLNVQHSSRPSARATRVLWLSALFGLVADLVTKWWAFRSVAADPVHILREDVLRVGPEHLYTLIPNHQPVNVWDGLLNFTLVLNPGAVFGLGAGRRWVFIVFTFGAIAFCLYLFKRWTTPRMRLAPMAIGLVLAGGLGNLYDRLIYGCVRDFIHPLPGRVLPWGVKWPNGSPEVWPYVSNVADLLLIIGIIVLGWYSFTEQPDQPSKSTKK